MTNNATSTFSDSVRNVLRQADRAASRPQAMTRRELLALAEALRNVKCDGWDELRSLYTTANKLSRLASANAWSN